jgi:hypothetical protein
MDDRLGKYIQHAISVHNSSASWLDFIQASSGPSDINPSIVHIHHPAHHYLNNIRLHGASVSLATDPWSDEQKQTAITRGSHPSTTLHRDFLRDELADMINQRFWTILPFDMVQQLPSLCLSPMGVVPQRDRRPRVIIDYTFSDVNLHTIDNVPKESMQFGQTFFRLLHRIHHVNRSFGPVYLIRIDLADGFYRIPLQPKDIPTLAVAFPHNDNEPPLVAFPLVLPMGWVNSPPIFCAFTETIADLANRNLRFQAHPPAPHRLTTIADNPNQVTDEPPSTIESSTWHRTPFASRIPSRPAAYVDIYMDDFLVIAQGSPTQLENVRTTLFHAIDDVFRPLHPSDAAFCRQEPVSQKKLHKGDGRWTTRRTILGWVIDTSRETIELPPHRAARLQLILSELLPRRRVGLKIWQQYLGELQSMVLALPGGRGLLSTLYTCFHTSSPKSRGRITRPMRDALHDLSTLAADLQQRPTRIGEIVYTLPVAYGTADASGIGMGGVWLSADPSFVHFVWRAPFTTAIQRKLISDHNPSGSITNSDLELAGQIAAQDVLLQQYDCRERTIALFTDNTAARAWQRKGLHTSLGPSAYLLRLLSLLQRHYRYLASFDYLPGPLNVMADDASRLFDLSDTALLNHFNTFYPQDKPWQLYVPRPEILSVLTMALCCKRSDPASYLPALNLATLPGFDGPPIVQMLASVPPARTLGIRYSSSKSLPIVTEPAASHPVVNLFDLVPWRTPSGPLARRWPYWGPLTPALHPAEDHTTSSNSNCVATAEKTPQPPESNPSQSPSFNT